MLLFAGLTVGCSSERPPFITAKIENVYHEESIVHNFAFLYWWEERGETPFLKPYELKTKELILEKAVPAPDNPRRVSFRTVRIPLQDIDSITISLSDFGKIIAVLLKNGETISATDKFPRLLKKGEKTGFADFSVYAVGTVEENGKSSDFKLERKFIKKIDILDIRL